MNWLFPYFLMAVCITGSGNIEQPRTFGPFQNYEDAQAAMSLLAYGFLCEPSKPERGWRWKEATPIYLREEDSPYARKP